MWLMLPLLCPPLTCRDIFSECVPSYYGTRCTECHYRGYLDEDGDCQCYESWFSDNKRCLSIYDKQYEIEEYIPMSSMIGSCEPLPASLGCYNAARDGCCESYIGPPPGELITLLFEECNTIGGGDPFETCSGNGVWDGLGCVCYRNWNLVPVGGGYYTCGVCFGFWGGDGCDEIWTPSVITGELMVCGGYGNMTQTGLCECQSDLLVEDTFDRQIYNGTVIPQIVSVISCQPSRLR